MTWWGGVRRPGSSKPLLQPVNLTHIPLPGWHIPFTHCHADLLSLHILTQIPLHPHIRFGWMGLNFLQEHIQESQGH